jgi:hypothetical protein
MVYDLRELNNSGTVSTNNSPISQRHRCYGPRRRMVPPDGDVRRRHRERSGSQSLRDLPPGGQGGRVSGPRQDVPGPPKDLVEALHPRKSGRVQVLGLPEQHKVLPK